MSLKLFGSLLPAMRAPSLAAQALGRLQPTSVGLELLATAEALRAEAVPEAQPFADQVSAFRSNLRDAIDRDSAMAWHLVIAAQAQLAGIIGELPSDTWHRVVDRVAAMGWTVQPGAFTSTTHRFGQVRAAYGEQVGPDALAAFDTALDHFNTRYNDMLARYQRRDVHAAYGTTVPYPKTIIEILRRARAAMLAGDQLQARCRLLVGMDRCYQNEDHDAMRAVVAHLPVPGGIAWEKTYEVGTRLLEHASRKVAQLIGRARAQEQSTDPLLTGVRCVQVQIQLQVGSDGSHLGAFESQQARLQTFIRFYEQLTPDTSARSVHDALKRLDCDLFEHLREGFFAPLFDPVRVLQAGRAQHADTLWRDIATHIATDIDDETKRAACLQKLAEAQTGVSAGGEHASWKRKLALIHTVAARENADNLTSLLDELVRRLLERV